MLLRPDTRKQDITFVVAKELGGDAFGPRLKNPAQGCISVRDGGACGRHFRERVVHHEIVNGAQIASSCHLNPGLQQLARENLRFVTQDVALCRDN